MFRGRDVEEINELRREGLSIRAIGRLTGYDRKTIRRQRPSAQPARAIASGRIKRSKTAVNEFKHLHPCPATGKTTGAVAAT